MVVSRQTDNRRSSSSGQDPTFTVGFIRKCCATSQPGMPAAEHRKLIFQQQQALQPNYVTMAERCWHAMQDNPLPLTTSAIQFT